MKTRLFSNLSWLAVGRAFELAISATVGVMVARHLGPDAFGRMSYVIALVGLFVVIVPLGLPSVLIRDLVRRPADQERLLGVAMMMQSVAGIVAYLLVMLAVLLTERNDPALISLVAVYGLMLLAKPAGAYHTWFEAEVQAKYIVRMQIIVLATASAFKLIAIYFDKGLWAILIIQTIAMCAKNIGIATVYTKQSHRKIIPAWDTQTARELLGHSWPLIISAIGLVLYLKIDQVMLGQMSSDAEVGIYSAALRLSEVWYTVPVMIVSTVFPALVRAHEQDAANYKARVSALLDLFNGLSILIALTISLLSSSLITLLYGPSYSAAGPVLALHVWAAVFIFMGTITGKWYLLAGIRHLNILRNFLGAGINILLNFWAIPIWGAWGAALATLVSYMAANYFADTLSARARPLFIQKTTSLLLWPRLLWRPRARLKKLSKKGPKS